jgi:hypothetical protein
MKNISLVVFISLLMSSLAFSQPTEKLADSLWKQGEFKKALRNYQLVMKQESMASPALLLKMANCASALRNYPAEIYYLNLCYQIAPSKSLQEQIRILANQYNLQGYNFSDLDLLLQYYYQTDDIVVLAGIAISLILVLAMFQSRYKGKQLVYYPLIFLVCIIGFAVANNIQTINQKAIIAFNNTMLMDGPSAASNNITKVSQGHRVTITAKTDVWYKVTWLNNTAYIHSKNLLLLPR